MALADFSEFIRTHYELHEWRHASTVLRHDFPGEWDDLQFVLETFRLEQEFIVKPGGNKSRVAKRIDGLFASRNWTERQFDIEITVDDSSHPSPTHSIDNFRNGVAQETEWNNKDPFFDRDLNNFRLLHQLEIVSVGIIVTRADELQDIYRQFGRGSSAGQSTTHMSKLLPKVEGGGADGCPLLAVGIKKELFVPES